MAVITRERWEKATPNQRYQWTMQGHVIPGELEALVPTAPVAKVKTRKVEAQPIDPDRVYQRIREAGITDEQLAWMSQTDPDFVRRFGSAKTEAGMVQVAQLAHERHAAQGQRDHEHAVATTFRQWQDGERSAAETIFALSQMSVDLTNPALAGILEEFAEDGEYGQEELQALAAHAENQAQLEAQLATNARASQIEARISELEEAAWKEVDEALEGLDPNDYPEAQFMIAEAVVTGEPPDMDRLLSVIEQAATESADLQRATDLAAGDREVWAKLAQGGTYGLMTEAEQEAFIAENAKPLDHFIDQALTERSAREKTLTVEESLEAIEADSIEHEAEVAEIQAQGAEAIHRSETRSDQEKADDPGQVRDAGRAQWAAVEAAAEAGDSPGESVQL